LWPPSGNHEVRSVLKAYQNTDFFYLFQGRLELVKSADEKVSDEAIKERRILGEQNSKAIQQLLPGLIRDEG
jgi:hypothetical protein